MKPYIGITCGEIQNKIEPWSPVTQGQGHTYIDAVVKAGGVPVLLPFCDDEEVLRQLYDLCSGMLFAGGNDLDPALYSQTPLPQTTDFSPRRDKQENLLLEWALEDDKPCFGICRGMQLLNVKLGGDLYQDIPSQLPEADDHESSTKAKSLTHSAHKLRVKPDSQFAHAIGANEIATNSHHHQTVQTLGEGLVATAWSEDGLIEALEYPKKRFVLAVQSHPESLTEAAPEWLEAFKAFIQAAKT